MAPIFDKSPNHPGTGFQENSPRCHSEVGPSAEFQIIELTQTAELTYFPEYQGLGINMLKCMFILILDLFLQIADGRRCFNQNRKDIVGAIADDPTKELDLLRLMFIGRCCHCRMDWSSTRQE